MCAPSQKTHHSQGRELPLRGIRRPVLDLCNCKLELCQSLSNAVLYRFGVYIRMQKYPVLCQHLQERVILI